MQPSFVSFNCTHAVPLELCWLGVELFVLPMEPNFALLKIFRWDQPVTEYGYICWHCVILAVCL